MGKDAFFGSRIFKVEAAAAYGVSQPTIFMFVRGDLSRLSLEYLVKMLALVGVTVKLVAAPPRMNKKSIAA